MDVPPLTFQAGDTWDGFKILRVEQIPEIRITAYEIIHEKTGARILHLHAFDRENLFAIGFRTPPPNSTGVPHILEHAVLAGSEKYPLKDAFNELHKGTLQTFINAFTYPDKTVYPVASQVKTDFYNLARVYTDLVLRPRLLKETFLQEGHHLTFVEPDDTESDLVISGIVYNEMKGAYSSPETLMAKAVTEALFPDTPYAHDSGGDPEVIPSLTYEQFLEFHRHYYSPSNAYIFIYGDIPTEEHLAFLSPILEGFERREVMSAIAAQPYYSAPRYVHATYPLARGEKREGKTVVNLAWLLAENRDVRTSLLLKVTCAMLVGSAAGPLRKALIDSRLGEDLSPITGLDSDYRQLFFVVGLRGTEPEKAPLIEKLVFDTLEKVVTSGFDRELIEGTLHQIEFHGKEIRRTTMPYGIVLMGMAFHTWLYDGDAFQNLNFPQAISELRKTWEENPQVFQETVKKWFLENNHRVLSVLEPDPDFIERREEKLREILAKLKERLSPEERGKIAQTAASLRRFQSEPDPPAAVAALPRLRLTDLPREIEKIPTEKTCTEGITILRHDIFTNGIAYLDLAFDISHIPEEYQVYLPLWGKLATDMGAAGLDYEAMAKRIALHAGGLSFHLTCGLATDGTPWRKMVFRVSSLYRNISEAIKILRDILLEGDLSQKERMYNLIAEKKNNLIASVVPSGHLYAKRIAAACLREEAFLEEKWHGRTQIRFIHKLSEEKSDLRELLSHLRAMVVSREGLTVNLTACQKGMGDLEQAAVDLIASLPERGVVSSFTPPSLPVPSIIGIVIPAQVSYVAKVLMAPTYGDASVASLFVAAHYLSNGYLYKRIRVQGGAYGGMCQYDPLLGIFNFLSYRDPHIIETIRIYNEVPKYLSEEGMDEDELRKAIIGTIGALDKPMDPATKGYTAMIRDFLGLSDKMRQELRGAILEMKGEKVIKEALHVFSTAEAKAGMAVLGAEAKLMEAKELLGEAFRIEPLI